VNDHHHRPATGCQCRVHLFRRTCLLYSQPGQLFSHRSYEFFWISHRRFVSLCLDELFSVVPSAELNSELSYIVTGLKLKSIPSRHKQTARQSSWSLATMLPLFNPQSTIQNRQSYETPTCTDSPSGPSSARLRLW